MRGLRLEAFASVLNREELAELLAKLAADAEAAAQRAGGSLLRFAEERFAAIFPSDAGGTGPAHTLKAIHGALTIVLAAQRLKPWTVSRFAGRDVPEVAVSVGIHLGTARLAPGRATGAVMDVASSLAQSGQALRWSIVASREAATAAGFALVSGRSARVKVPKAKGKLAVVEIKGVEKSDRLAPDAAKVATLIGAAVDRNAGTDFAVATIVEYAMGEAGTGVMVRSPDYLSPELVNGDPADMQTDVYTLGLLLYEMLTGQRPYMSADLSRVMMDHLSAPVPKLPAALERFQPLLDRLMAKNRKERFESVAEAIGFMAQQNRPA